MSVMIEKKDIINIAVKIEENGESFYREASEKAERPEVKELLTVLAKDEIKHKEIFTNMLKRLNLSDEPLSEEYQKYLKAYTDRLVFKENADDFSKKMKNFDQLWALDFAIQKELDSILYYYELKNIIAIGDHHLVNSIISEERSHFEKLSRMKSILINS